MREAFNFHEYTERLRRMRDALDDEQTVATLKHASDQGYRDGACKEMGRVVAEIINKIIDKTGKDQKQIAEELGVAEATLCAWKRGKIHWIKLCLLIHYARGELNSEVDNISVIFDTIQGVAATSAAIEFMEILRKCVGESVKIPLTEEVYRCETRNGDRSSYRPY